MDIGLVKKDNVYNAFLLPVDKKKNGGGDLRHIGYATSKWEKNGLMYEKIHTFFIELIFVKRIMIIIMMI